jgi:hypothetical protein
VKALVRLERFIDSTTFSLEGVISAQVITSANHSAGRILQPTSATSESDEPSLSFPFLSSSSALLVSTSESDEPSLSFPFLLSSSPFLVSSNVLQLNSVDREEVVIHEGK